MGPGAASGAPASATSMAPAAGAVATARSIDVPSVRNV